MNNYLENIKKRAYAMIEDEQYLENWFGAIGFFNETFKTGVIKRNRRYFFITRDEMFTGKGIYALREITTEGIETLAGPLDSEDQALDALEAEFS